LEESEVTPVITPYREGFFSFALLQGLVSEMSRDEDC